MQNTDMNILENGLQTLGLTISKKQVGKLCDYITTLQKWNKSFNLTAITDTKKIIIDHILDSLGIHKYITEKSYIDVGTGAGLPGIPLAICLPKTRFTLLDSSHKRTVFLTHLKNKLGLKNIEVIYHNAKTFTPKSPYDAVITRAFSNIQNMLDVTKHLCKPKGYFLAMKANVTDEEIASIQKNTTNTLENIYDLEIPQQHKVRKLVVLRNV
ncbi:MAG: 16S rRNA (guanine(527)-N(7))-methyltransferase RsmG [Thiotrichales bacterium]|nr:MAG: 16S rRNA (guanine(527)-N(7))-methyltransferase RsmG [Thiotrichales bacterium]